MPNCWEAHALPDRAASDAHRPQQRLCVAGLHQRAHSVTDPYHAGARHRHQQTVRPVSAEGQRRDGPHARQSAYDAPPPAQDYGYRGPGATGSEYRTPSAAEFYAGVWQPPSSPRHSNVPSVGGYQAPEQPVYASDPAPSGVNSYPMSPPYTPAPGASYASPAVGYAQTPPPPTPSSPYTPYQGYQQPYQTQPFSPVSPQQPSGVYQAYRDPNAPYQQPQGQYTAYRPQVPALKVSHQSSGVPPSAAGQSFIAELPAEEVPSTRMKPDRQQPVELMAETPAWKDPVLGGDTAEQWAEELSKRFERTTIDAQNNYSGSVEAPAPLRIRKSTKKTGDHPTSSTGHPRTFDVGGLDQPNQSDPAQLIHQHLWSGSRQGPAP
ncbi:hypothetical protein MGG_07673 [Pyricularia oryzae 70-15]|uniref:Uncharacterized protein n=3 Tax=Pyricularia oryzae TaxID=318829 RepID=G4N3C8_PYRO7|nr:uncharacterized protein MGG_07673 [Pyricularia oryzae 70-15]EHA51806.1 hypothetical protein MGG_07673 [Pyricularia oryzae 70-15]ELQ33562.1 hypothetical protein OOU_Y34scaffold00926g22 [Pyricularia oryzae Y34]KAI7916605.1 hypothetical protein M0657_008510 [Pyricularia oryzae]